mgnify:CR=1 FL=1
MNPLSNEKLPSDVHVLLAEAQQKIVRYQNACKRAVGRVMDICDGCELPVDREELRRSLRFGEHPPRYLCKECFAPES